MPPKKGGGGGGGGGRGGGGDKKAQLWDGIRTAQLPQLRYGLANAGIVPASRNEEGLTTFLLAASLGVDKSLAELVRWYERRDRELRLCLEQLDEDTDRSSLHLSCALGSEACVKVLLDACSSLDANNAFLKAQLARKDASGCTPRECAAKAGKAKVVALLDDFMHESEDEADEDVGAQGAGAAAADGALSSTQLSKMKKLALLEKETGTKTVTGAAAGEIGAAKAERGVLSVEMPEPVWAEVAAWAASVKLLRPVCELNIDKTPQPDAAAAPPPGPAAAEDGAVAPPHAPLAVVGGGEVVDPALWHCHTLNRLQLRMGPALTALRADGLAKLTLLTTLIVSGNGLTSLPAVLPKTLENLDVSYNQLTSLAPLQPCAQLVTLALDANRLASLDELPLAHLGRLLNLSACDNAIEALPDELGCLEKLETLVVNGNLFTEVPAAMASCKKLQAFKIDDCPVKDNKIKKYLAAGEMKNLLKYLEKSGAGAGGGGGKKGKGGKKK